MLTVSRAPNLALPFTMFPISLIPLPLSRDYANFSLPNPSFTFIFLTPLPLFNLYYSHARILRIGTTYNRLYYQPIRIKISIILSCNWLNNNNSDLGFESFVSKNSCINFYMLAELPN